MPVLPAAEALAPRRTAPLQRHMILLVLIAVLPLGLISGAIVAQHAERERRDFGDRLTERAATVALALDREIEVITTALAVMATAPALREGGDRAAFSARARAVEAALNNVLVLHEVSEAQSEATPPSLREVFASGKPGIGRASERGAPLVSGLPVFEPVLRGGRTIAVLEMALTEPQISTVLAGQNRGHDALGMVLDPAGHVAGAAGSGAVPPGSMAPDWLRAAAADPHQNGLSFGAWADQAEHVCALDRPARARQWSVAVCALRERYEGEWLDPLRERGLTLLGSLFIGITVATAAARRFVLPLTRLTERARGVARRQDDRTEVPESAVSEFEALRISVREAELALRREAAAAHSAMQDARTAQRLLTSVIDGVTEGIVVHDLAGACVLMNKSARQTLGAAGGEGPETDASVVAAMSPRAFEITRSIDGVPRQFALTQTTWRDATGAVAGVVTVSHDVTDARAREARLRTLQAELLRTTRLSSMGAMTSGLAHEINQPLAAAANFLSAGLRLADRAEDDATDRAHARAAIEDAKAQVLRAGAIVRRLRDFVARGEAELHPEPVAEVIEEARALARADGADLGIPIALAVEPDAGNAMLDRTQIQQVLLNLIRNAAEAIASRPGGITAEDCITLTAARDAARRVVIRIADTGPGLPEEVAARLFQPFVSTKTDGLGIGLAICHTIIVGHGGQLLHQAGAAGGAEFTILLPTHSQEPGLSA